MFQLKVQLKGATDSRMRGDESAIMTYYNEICNKNESFEETNDEQTLCNDFGPWVWANGIQYFHDYNKRLVGNSVCLCCQDSPGKFYLAMKSESTQYQKVWKAFQKN